MNWNRTFITDAFDRYRRLSAAEHLGPEDRYWCYEYGPSINFAQAMLDLLDQSPSLTEYERNRVLDIAERALSLSSLARTSALVDAYVREDLGEEEQE